MSASVEQKYLKELDEQIGVKESPTRSEGPTEDAAITYSSKNVFDNLARNEDGDAAIYVELNRGRFIFDAAAARWYSWTGHFWREDTLDQATRAIDGVIDIYAQEAIGESWRRLKAEKSGKKEDAERYQEIEDSLLKRIRALQTIARKKNVLALARTGAESLVMRGDEWDRDPWLLACQNGIIDLQTGQSRPGKPDDWIKTPAPIEYQGLNTPAPAWEKFISDICGEYHDHPAYLQRLLGYGITGLTNWHIYPIFYGPLGRNGKGTMLETIKFTLGDLAYKARAETLIESKYTQRGAADADTLAFRGKRIVWASETGEDHKLNASRIKELCGGDTLSARAPYGRNPIEFYPSHLLILLTNDRPQTSPNDAALWERIHLVPFDIRFVDRPKAPNEKKADHHLLEKLKLEAPGILSWLIRGCLAWQQEGLNPPDSVIAATSEYRREEDIIQQFISDRCLVGPTYEVQAGPLYKAYTEWTAEMGVKPISGIKFGKEIRQRFDIYEKRYVFYIGIKLVSKE